MQYSESNFKYSWSIFDYSWSIFNYSESNICRLFPYLHWKFSIGRDVRFFIIH